MVELKNRYEKQYTSARNNVLLMAALTLLSVALSLVNFGVSFPFSAAIPQVCADLGMILYVYGYPVVWVMVFAGVAVLLPLIYALGAFFSKKRGGWMIAILALFSVDCVGLVYWTITNVIDMVAVGESVPWVSYIIEVLFHVWIMYYIVRGVVAHTKLRQLPVREEVAIPAAPPATTVKK